MTQAKVKPLIPLTFKQYLEYDDGSDIRYDLLANGELIAVPSEAEINYYLAMLLYGKLSAFVNFRLIMVHVLTMEVNPVGDNYKNRRPDVAVLRPEHLQLDSIINKTALCIGAPAPQFVAEIVSPGGISSDNYRRDYEWKRQQYQTWGIPEYWIIDPHRMQVTVLALVEEIYQATVYKDNQQIHSDTFPELNLTAQLLLDT